MNKLKRFLFTAILLFIIIIIPFLFNCLFFDEEKTHFWFITSSISVSDWFSFWISYLSLLVSSVLAYAAIKLTNTVEYNNTLSRVDQNVSLLKITQLKSDLELKDMEKTNYELKVTMSRDVLCFTDLEIKNAYIVFENREKFILKPENKNEGSGCFKLFPEQSEDKNELKQHTKNFLKWKYWESQLTQGYETVNLMITYKYVLPSFGRMNRVFVCETDVLYKIKSKLAQEPSIEILETATLRKELLLKKKGKK